MCWGTVKGGTSGAKSAPFEVFWGVVLRVIIRAGLVRFGAAVVRFCAAVVRWGAVVVRVGAGEAHQRARVENEERRVNGLFWPFFDVFWRF